MDVFVRSAWQFLLVWIYLSPSTALAQHGHGPMYHFPQWSPDGTQILVSATLDGDSEIYVLSVHRRSRRQLTDNTANDDAARWTHGGRRIAFMSDRRGRTEPYTMNADGTNQRPLDVLPPSPDSVSSDRRTKLLEETVDGLGVIVAQHQDGTRRVLTTGLHAEQPSFSPDGNYIVYEQRSPAAPDDVARSNIVVANADGTMPRVVSSGTDPSWSPDGQLLLFKLWDASKKQLHIATVGPDGARLRQLAPGVHPHWSPDGRRIAFMRDNMAGTDIWIMGVDGSGQVCITCANNPCVRCYRRTQI
jgi:Tol biopolymer transport system component